MTGLKVGASYDYLGISDQSLSDAAWANATAIYASYQLTEKLTLYARGEYASTDTAALLGAEQVVAVTTTLQYDLWNDLKPHTKDEIAQIKADLESYGFKVGVG